MSEITALECAQFLQKEVTLVTPNGFEDTFVPTGTQFDIKRHDGRRKLLEVAETMFGQKFGEDVFMIATSGRYEFRNKGIDLFIDALGELNKSPTTEALRLLLIILIPANHYGPRKDLLSEQSPETMALSDQNTSPTICMMLNGIQS